MSAAWLLLLCCDVSAPLGPYARLGVPVLLEVSGPKVILVEGWRYAARPQTLIHPSTLPCTIRDESGRFLLRLEPVPEKKLLVGLAGIHGSAIDQSCAAGYEPLLVEGIRPDAVPRRYWRVFDVFDRVVAPAPEGALAEWGKALGSISADSPIRPALLAPPGNLAARIYDRIEWPRERSDAYAPGRLIVLAAACACALLLLLARRQRRPALAGLLGVCLLAATVGWVRTRQNYRATVVRRLEIRYFRAGSMRSRVYRAYLGVGPGARVRLGPEETPLFYRAASEPWWKDPERVCLIDQGVMRVTLSEERENGSVPDPLPAGARPIWVPLLPFLRPRRGNWRTVSSNGELQFVAQD